MLSRLATGAMITAQLLGGNMSAQAASPAPQGTNSVLNVAQQVGKMAVPKDRPTDFGTFKTNYLFSIYHYQVMNGTALSNPSEGFAGGRYNAFLGSLITDGETKGKYTPKGTKTNYVVHNGTNYCQRVPDPSGNYTIGDGLALKGNSTIDVLLAPYLKNNVAFDKQWKPITNSKDIKGKMEYLEATTAATLRTKFLGENRSKLRMALKKKGLNFDGLDAYAKLALEDLAYNVGPYFTYKKMIEALAKPTPDYVKAAFELCNSKDFESFGGLRERRIAEAHLMLMAAKRQGGMDIYLHQFETQAGNNSEEGKPQENVPSQTGTITHCVGKGDTVYGIAKKYGAKVADIIDDNNLDTKGTIELGQNLIVRLSKPEQTPNMEPPKPSANARWHKVAPGETASGIAVKYGISMEKLKSLNTGIKNFDFIRMGTKIRVG